MAWKQFSHANHGQSDLFGMGHRGRKSTSNSNRQQHLFHDLCLLISVTNGALWRRHRVVWLAARRGFAVLSTQRNCMLASLFLEKFF
jgi:hypothetical protein